MDYDALYMYYDHDYEIASALQDLFFILPFGQILYQMSNCSANAIIYSGRQISADGPLRSLNSQTLMMRWDAMYVDRKNDVYSDINRIDR